MFMRGSRKFYQRGSKFDNVFFLFFFFVDGWRKDQNTTISGPLSARQRAIICSPAGHYLLASETPLEWCFSGVSMMALH